MVVIQLHSSSVSHILTEPNARFPYKHSFRDFAFVDRVKLMCEMREERGMKYDLEIAKDRFNVGVHLALLSFINSFFIYFLIFHFYCY